MPVQIVARKYLEFEMVFLFTRKVGFAEKFPTICLDISNTFFFVHHHKTNATSFIHLHVAQFEIMNENLDKKKYPQKKLRIIYVKLENVRPNNDNWMVQ